jgi:DNA-binding response OmpR family regulator
MASLVREIQGTIWVDQVAITGIQALPKKILLYLIKHRGRMVTFYELADVYWGASSDQSSLYTMAKAIQKIRDAFKTHGIHQEIIKTVRKQGYILL